MWKDRGTLVRTSGASVEYLIQRVWATDLKNATMVHFTAPKRMLSKSAACYVAGLRKLALFPMELGDKSLNVSHGIWDRGVYTAALRLFCQQHHRAVEGQLQTTSPGEGRGVPPPVLGGRERARPTRPSATPRARRRR